MVTFVTAICVILTSGCGAIRRDLQYPGGYPGFLLDRHSFNASSSKELLLLRSTMVLAMAARMGQATVRGEDADAFALSLKAAAREINFAAANLYPVDAVEPCSVATTDAAATTPTPPATLAACPGYRVNFESETPLIEARLIKVVVAALPTDKARQFLAAIASGDVLGAAFKGLNTFRSLAAGLHYANGSFRSGLEIVATQACGQGYVQANGTVAQAVTCLDLPPDILASTEHTRSALAHVSPTAFDALMRIANGACTALPFLKPDDGTTTATAAPATIDSSERDRACGAIWFAPAARRITLPPPPPPPALPVADQGE